MTLYQFIALDQMQQRQAIWEGVVIAERENEDYKIVLYQIDAFYVEVFNHKYYNVIGHFRPFRSVNELAPYLDKIKITI